MNDSAQQSTTFSFDQHRLKRLGQYIAQMVITFAVSIANLWLILAYSDTAGLPERLAIAVGIVSITAFGALGGKATLDEIKAVIDDQMDTEPGTRASRLVAGLPHGLYTVLTVLLILLLGVVQLWALFA